MLHETSDRILANNLGLPSVAPSVAQGQTGIPAPASLRRAAIQFGTQETALMSLLKHWLRPVTVVLTLLGCGLATGATLSAEYAALALVALLVSAQVFGVMDFQVASRSQAREPNFLRLLGEWLCIVAILLLIGFSLQVTHLFSGNAIIAWFLVTPLTLLLTSQRSASWLARQIIASSPATPRYIVIGATELGQELLRRLQQDACAGKFMGFFDFRNTDRLSDVTRTQLVGRCDGVANYVRQQSITAIYITLPISPEPRITHLLNELQDSTASVYFVPNVFAFDLVQPQCVDVNGIPAISICDTPLHGMSELRKRLLDIALASAALLAIWPVLLGIAAAIKLTSPGPVLFKQRRYGLNSEEILVFKFRSMTVCENGTVVTQATKQDRRITPLGAFLRRTSLDELPQILNVLQGTMSFVGPRPHAVAHNEQYRKLIGGYMIRHKMRPGITGWAQVNGLRGETETVEKMRQRVLFDIDYINNWSIWFDLRIILRTFTTVLRGDNAY